MCKAKTKYPIVLVHGMMVKDFFFYRAFRSIPKHLRAAGCTVYVSNQDGVGTIQNNAAQLKKEVERILEKEGAQKVNIIAHSKGGLDSRYMISMLDMGDRVASLTTLSTPHHGSKMSATILKMPKFFAAIINLFCNLWYRIFGDKHPDLISVGRQLTDTEMAKFNQDVVNDSRVYYQSYSSTVNDRRAFLMYIPYLFSRYCECEETDGMVSVSSAKWGEYRGEVPLSSDHINMVGIAGRKRKKAINEFYVSIANELKNKGF